MIAAADASGGPIRRWVGSAMGRAALLLRGRSGDTVWALFDQGTGLVSAMLSFLLLGRTLGAAGYGAFVGVYALISPFLALTQTGVYLAAAEHVARAGEDPVEATRSFLSITVVSAFFWVPALSAVGLHSIQGLPPVAVIFIVGGEFCLNGIFSTCQAVLWARTGYSAAARLRMVVAMARIVLLTGLAAAGSLTLTTLAVGQVVALGVIGMFAITRVSRLLGTSARPGRIRRRHVRSTLLYGVGIGASMAQNNGDKFVLNAAQHQADAGRYGAAYRLMMMVLLPVNALAGATHLSFLNAAESATGKLRRAIRLSLIAAAYAAPAALCLVLVAPLVPRILTKEFAETTSMLQTLAPVVILRGIGVFPMNGLMGLGRNGPRTTILLGNALLSLLLYVALIPRYSWRGALVATLVSESLLCVSGWVALLLYTRSWNSSKSQLAAGGCPSETAEREPGPG